MYQEAAKYTVWVLSSVLQTEISNASSVMELNGIVLYWKDFSTLVVNNNVYLFIYFLNTGFNYWFRLSLNTSLVWQNSSSLKQ